MPSSISKLPLSFHIAETNVERVGGRRLSIILRAPGCVYLRSEASACTFCGFRHLSSPGLRIEAADYAAQVRSVLVDLGSALKGIIELNLYNSGNFFCDAELSAAARCLMATELARCSGLRAITVDSRPEFVTRDRLAEFRDAFGSSAPHLFVGLGLELHDDQLRSSLLNKRFGQHDFTSSLEALRAEGYGALVYLMVKPGMMSEAKALDEIQRSGNYVREQADKLGLNIRFALEPTFVVEGTPLARLYNEGCYEPPTLELVAEAAAILLQSGPVNVGLWDEDMPILARAGSPDEADLLNALRVFNQSQDASVLKAWTGLSCMVAT